MERNSLPQLDGNREKNNTGEISATTTSNCAKINPEDHQKLRAREFPEKKSEIISGNRTTSFDAAHQKLVGNFKNSTHQAGPSGLKNVNDAFALVKKSDAAKFDLDVTKGNKPKVDIHRINELDSFGNQNQSYQFPCSRTFTNHFPGPLTEVAKKFCKENKDPAPGASTSVKKKKPTKGESKNSAEDIRAIANCILENSLNRINSNREINLIEHQLIQSLQQQPSSTVKIDLTPRENEDLILLDIDPFDTIPSNNNNKLEHVITPNLPPTSSSEDPTDITKPPALEDSTPPATETEQEVARASREALFDPDSEISLLEDYDLAPLFPDIADLNQASSSSNRIFLIGLNFISEDEAGNTGNAVNNNGFPDWLLQIMLVGNPAAEEPESHDEPHFYCQGDGVGVHPSVIAVDVEEAEGASTDSSTTSSEDFAEADQDQSQQDILPPIEEDVSNEDPNSLNLVITTTSLPVPYNRNTVIATTNSFPGYSPFQGIHHNINTAALGNVSAVSGPAQGTSSSNINTDIINNNQSIPNQNVRSPGTNDTNATIPTNFSEEEFFDTFD